MLFLNHIQTWHNFIYINGYYKNTHYYSSKAMSERTSSLNKKYTSHQLLIFVFQKSHLDKAKYKYLFLNKLEKI